VAGTKRPTAWLPSTRLGLISDPDARRRYDADREILAHADEAAGASLEHVAGGTAAGSAGRPRPKPDRHRRAAPPARRGLARLDVGPLVLRGRVHRIDA
jgi:hypothetical protein